MLLRPATHVGCVALLVECAGSSNADCPSSDSSRYTSANPACTGCPDEHTDPSKYLGKACGEVRFPIVLVSALERAAGQR